MGAYVVWATYTSVIRGGVNTFRLKVFVLWAKTSLCLLVKVRKTT